MIVRLVQDEATFVCTVGGYTEDDFILCPDWFFYTLAKGETAKVECLWNEDNEGLQEEYLPLPLATKIVLKPLDNEFYHADIEEELSRHLEKFKCLQKGVTLIVPLESLGGFEVDIFVENCEPSSEVLLRGDVPLELAEPLENIVEWNKSPGWDKATEANNFYEMSRAPEQKTMDFDGSMFETQETQETKFVAFSGKGNVLG
jgi:hypothetical protein